MNGLIGKKIGMTQVWDAEGRRVAVTVLEVGPCPVVQVKSKDTDGYDAVQVGFEAQKPQRLTKAVRTRFEKAGVAPCRELREFDAEGDAVKVGDTLTVGVFDGVKLVDVTATTKGKGFAGVMRRYGMGGGPMTHGGHSKRRIGSIGERDLPGWIAKGGMKYFIAAMMAKTSARVSAREPKWCCQSPKARSRWNSEHSTFRL